MNLRDFLSKRKGETIVKAPDIRINKYWTIEMGQYWDTINRKPTKDFYFGLKFKINW